MSFDQINCNWDIQQYLASIQSLFLEHVRSSMHASHMKMKVVPELSNEWAVAICWPGVGKVEKEAASFSK